MKVRFVFVIFICDRLGLCEYVELFEKYYIYLLVFVFGKLKFLY